MTVGAPQKRQAPPTQALTADNLTGYGRRRSLRPRCAGVWLDTLSAGAWQSGFMRLGVLGPLLVTVDGERVQIGGVRLRALLIRLALDAGRMVTMVSLASALWPDDGRADRGAPAPGGARAVAGRGAG